MNNILNFLSLYIDYIIFGILGMMSFVMLWKVIERAIFFARLDVARYSTIHDLEIDLTRNLTALAIVGSNAPYVGLLGTVIGILLTFYAMGQAGGDIDAASIMINLSLALKATAVGILVAIPSMMFYSGFNRKVDVNKMKWLALQQK